MRSRLLAAYLAAVLVVSAGVIAYKGYEVRAGLPPPEPSVIADERTVALPPAQALERLSDPGSWEALPGVESASSTGPGMVSVVLREWLVSVSVTAEHEVRPGYQQLRVVGGYLDGATLTQTFEPDGGDTRVSTVLELDLSVLRMVSADPEQLARERLDAALSALAG